jgi:hypothetical protein
LVTFNDNVIVRRPTKINPLGEESIAQLRLHPQTRTRTALTQGHTNHHFSLRNGCKSQLTVGSLFAL